jgi:hypothetical protein
MSKGRERRAEHRCSLFVLFALAATRITAAVVTGYLGL